MNKTSLRFFLLGCLFSVVISAVVSWAAYLFMPFFIIYVPTPSYAVVEIDKQVVAIKDLYWGWHWKIPGATYTLYPNYIQEQRMTVHTLFADGTPYNVTVKFNYSVNPNELTPHDVNDVLRPVIIQGVKLATADLLYDKSESFRGKFGMKFGEAVFWHPTLKQCGVTIHSVGPESFIKCD